MIGSLRTRFWCWCHVVVGVVVLVLWFCVTRTTARNVGSAFVLGWHVESQ